MKKLIIILGLAMAFAGASGANHPIVKVENVEIGKVIVKHGLSMKAVNHHFMKMVKCMLTLKKHKTAEEAMDAAKAKIDTMCEKYGLDDKKCHKIQKKVGMGIHHCFMKAEFIREFFKDGAAEAPAPAEAPAEVK